MQNEPDWNVCQSSLRQKLLLEVLDDEGAEQRDGHDKWF